MVTGAHNKSLELTPKGPTGTVGEAPLYCGLGSYSAAQLNSMLGSPAWRLMLWACGLSDAPIQVVPDGGMLAVFQARWDAATERHKEQICTADRWTVVPLTFSPALL